MVLQVDLTADQVFYRLSDVYFVGVIIILGLGFIITTRVTYLFFSNYKKLNSVVKSYMSVILPDIFMVGNFWFRDLYNIHLGYLDEGPWCEVSAFIAIMAITALNCGAVCVAYTTYKLVQGEQMPDIYVIYWNIGSWVFATILAGIFLFGGLLGPYKGLYCCVKETQYRAYAVAPIILVTFTAIFMMGFFYFQSYQIIAQAESKRTGAAGGSGAKASELVMKRGILLVSIFYGCWSIIIFAGFSTSIGFKFHSSLDMFGAWLSKLMPILDSFILLQMLNRIINKGNKVGASEASAAEEGKAKPPPPTKPGAPAAKPAAPTASAASKPPASAPAAAKPGATSAAEPVPVGSKAAIGDQRISDTNRPSTDNRPSAAGPAPATAAASGSAPEKNPFIPPPLLA